MDKINQPVLKHLSSQSLIKSI